MSKSAKRPVALAVGLVLSFTAVGGAAFAAVDAGKTIAARIDNYKKIGSAFKTINDGLKSDTPDAKAIAAQAKIMKDLSAQIPNWFPKGTGPESGVKTRAKAEIWSDWATFAASAKSLNAESAKLETIAKAGDLEAIKAQVRVTGGTCKSCHDKFRGPEIK